MSGLFKINAIFPQDKKISWMYLLTLSIWLFLFFSMLSISISQSFLALGLIIWLLLLIRKKINICLPGFAFPLAAYVALSIISAACSFNPEDSLLDCRELLLYLIIPIACAGLGRAENLRTANRFLLASALFNCVYSTAYALFWAAPNERVTGFMGHYMTQSGLLLIFSCLALSLVFSRRGSERMIWAAGFLLALIAMTLTLTRSAWIGLGAAICLIILLHKPKIFFAVPLAFLILFFAVPDRVKNRALSIFSLKDESNRHRIEYIKAGWEIIKKYPLVGVGPDIVDREFKNPKYGLSEGARQNVHLHNNIFQIGAERGLPALAAWFVFLIWMAISLVKQLKNKDPGQYGLTVAALAGLIGLFLAGLFEYNFADAEVSVLFLYLLTIPFIRSLTVNKTRQKS
ncbi:MAG: O-antigen ligase family protein [Candidatus Aminicenantes bacterium]|nr:O-antigen ligase family protein [Candidatus Aminicenantes bacterium]